jgi:hypothetical protein
MKKFIVFSLIAFVMCSCNLEQKRIAEERARFVADSLAKREQFIRDSIIQVREREKFVKDSLITAFNTNFLKTPQTKCRAVEDDYKTIIWYKNPYFYELNDYNFFTIYLGQDTRTNKVWIVKRVSFNLWDNFSRRARYCGNGKYLIIDGESYSIESNSAKPVDSGPYYGIDYDDSISIELIIKIITTKNPIEIVIYGDEGFKPLRRTLTNTEIKAIKSVYYQYLLLTK